MRRAALGLLVVSNLGGCNQILGLEPTILDAPVTIIPDAPPANLSLGFLQLTFNPGAMVPAPVLAPFPDVTSVKIGTADGPLQDAPVGDTPGGYNIPLVIATPGPYRLVYQRTGDPVVHEYQDLGPNAHLVEALFGPVTRPAIPTNAGVLIKPMSPPAGYTKPRVFTLGTFTEGAGTASGTSVDYVYSGVGTASMSGPLGLPVSPDTGVVVDYGPEGGCDRSVGSSRFPLDSLATHGSATGDSWNTLNVVMRVTSVDVELMFPPEIRPFSDEGAFDYRETYGVVPSLVMPAFTRPGRNQLNSPAFLKNPVLLPLRACQALGAGGMLHVPVIYKDRFKEVVYNEVSADRSIGGVHVTNGFGLLTINPTSSTNLEPKIAVAVAKTATFASSAGTKDLFVPDTTDDIPIPAATGARTLTWTWSNSKSADYWEVTLVELGAFVPVDRKTYTVTNAIKNGNTSTTSARIDAADLVAGKKYVFRISGFTGAPNAKASDYSRIEGNQQMSAVHTHSFSAP